MRPSFYFTIKKPLLLVAVASFTIFGYSASAQTIDVGPPDTSVCGGDPITLIAIAEALVGGGNIVASTPQISCDDCHSQVIDIGFNFEFFGNTYNQCVIGSNGYITFDLTEAGGYSPWGINQAAPFPGTPDDAIMFPWQDIHPGISTSTPSATNCGDGTFIVDFQDISMFSCTTLGFTMQAVLYEGTNIIETYITEKPLCSTWNDGAAIHGLENSDGTQAVIVPGRNFPDQWAVTNDAVRFTPDGSGSYTIDQTIPFAPIPVSSETYTWTDDQGTVLGTDTFLTVSPTEPTWYWCTYQSPCAAITVVDSILVTIGNADMTADSINTSCVGFDDGGVIVDPTGSVYPATVEVLDANTLTVIQSMNNVSGPVTLGGTLGSNLPQGNYLAQVTDAVGCVTQVNFVILDPAPLTFTATPTDATCLGYDDGYVIVNQDGNAVPPLTFVADSGAFATQITGVNILDTLEGLFANDYTITMIDANNCPGTPVDVTIGEPTDLVPNAGHLDILCYGETTGRAWAQPYGSVGPYQLQWNDEFAQTTDTANWLPAGTYNVLITDAQNCFTDTDLVIIQPTLLELELTAGEDTCDGFKPGFLKAQMSGGVPPYYYTWSHISNPDNFYVDTLNYFALDSTVLTGDYSVIVLDSNNCEVSGEVSVPLIPSPIAAFVSRSKPEEIIDPYALFDNNSELATSYEWEFGDGYTSFLENPEHEYRDTSGTFLVKLTAYNDPVYGCSDEAWQYMDVAPYFTFYVPSAFTPDGDGMNDEFGPQGTHFDYETYRMTIYDRWGSEVFKTDNPELWWDGNMRRTGEQVKDGVYIYVFEIKKFNIFEPKVITGTVTVHRQHVEVK